MNYIVMDLEWNQCPTGKEHEVKGLPFEIIEIGAVKLNERCEVVGRFDQFVKPVIYKELHYIIKNLVDINSEELTRGGTFQEVVNAFLDWCGEEYIFCVWGNGDLTELQRNMKYYQIENQFPMPFIFYDIQKFYSILYEDGKVRRSLQFVAEALGINEDSEFHRAINDAEYTAGIMGMMDIEKVKGYYSIDCYRVPYRKSQEIHAVYDTYEKYISKSYRTREGAIENKESVICHCYKCGRECRPVIPWFSSNTKVYYGLFECEEHGYIKTRMRPKMTEDGKFYAMKITKITDEAGAEKIRVRQELLREKRKERRHHENGGE